MPGGTRSRIAITRRALGLIEKPESHENHVSRVPRAWKQKPRRHPTAMRPHLLRSSSKMLRKVISRVIPRVGPKAVAVSRVVVNARISRSSIRVAVAAINKVVISKAVINNGGHRRKNSPA